ncbi:MAG: glycosyltransferase [Planctomycetes bacterium]|nr:glycosyltransferase [Planctomycetota bacterium]
MKPSILFVSSFYPEFLRDLYAGDPTLAELGYEEQKRRLLATKFSSIDAYCDCLDSLGCRTDAVILYADRLMERWAAEHGVTLTGNVHDQRRQFVAECVRRFKPDILYVFEWSPLGDAFLADVKRHVRLLVGQIASPLRPDRTYAATDLMISSWPPIVDYFRREGKTSAYINLAFDERVLDRLPAVAPRYDVTFVGGFAPSHPTRIAWLDRLLRDVDIDVFGYGLDTVPQDSPICEHHRGPVWGYRMYETLQRSRITLNLHAVNDVRGTVMTNVANNLRLYEATGVGTCLLTDAKDNLHELLDPTGEVVAYRDDDDCVEKIRYFLDHEDERRTIAAAGQRRTLRDHTYTVRMAELLDVLVRHL